MDAYETVLTVPVKKNHDNLIQYLKSFIENNIKADETPIRLCITKTDNDYYHCDVGVMTNKCSNNVSSLQSIFEYKQRTYANAEQFNVALLVPTGVDAAIGGHSGDSCAISKLFGKMCDNLITHPNVVNAADINEMPDNTLYVEGSSLSRLLMGTIGLQKVHSNRVLLVMDDNPKEIVNLRAINSINAARASYGLNCENIVKLSPSVELNAYHTEIGKAVGTINHLSRVYNALDRYKGTYDAVAFATKINAEMEVKLEYYKPDSDLANPWGGVEAMFTHAVSTMYNIPAAHSPTLTVTEEDIQSVGDDAAIVDPRKAAEVVSLSFLQCILKGLQKSPKIISNMDNSYRQGILTVNDVTCLITPDNCVGLPLLAALEQGIHVIAVKANTNLMRNNLQDLPWRPGQFYIANNYLEAVGILAAIKEGITLTSVTRPIKSAVIETINFAH